MAITLQLAQNNLNFHNIYIENKQVNTYLNMKKLVKLTESDLHRIVNESVKRIVKEGIRADKINPEDVKGLEQDIINAYQKQQGMMYCELPQEAIQAAQEQDGIDLNEEWYQINQSLANALRHFRAVKYYMNIPFKNFLNDIDI
jgi:polyhydroxyalkanoate synthesis regulator phasin